MKPLPEKISDIAKKYCPDYPHVEFCGSTEQLYAIESTLDGIQKANEDLHAVIEKLRNKLGMSLEEYVTFIEQK